VLVNGQVQKEKANGEVTIPYGDYGLRLRNKNQRRAVAQIWIDGENVSQGGVVIPAQSYVDVYRRADRDVAFHFVPLDSAEAVDAGKNGPNPDKLKGVVECRFFLEKEAKPVYRIQPDYHPWTPPKAMCSSDPGRSVKTCDIGASSVISRSCDCMGFDESGVDYEEPTSGGVVLPQGAPPAQDGCTIDGAATGQRFSWTHVDIESTYTSVRLFLQGYVAPAVQGPVCKIYCDACGAKAARESSRFCHACGTKL
jgi:hypothetical protein